MLVEDVQAGIPLARLEHGAVHDGLQRLRELGLDALVLLRQQQPHERGQEPAALGARGGGEVAAQVPGVAQGAELEHLHGQVPRVEHLRLALFAELGLLEKGHQRLEQLVFHHPLVEVLALAGRHLLCQPAHVLQEEQALQVLLLDLYKELIQQRRFLLQVVHDDRQVRVDHLRHGHKGGVIKEPRKHNVLEVLQSVVEMDAIQHVCILEVHDLVEVNLDLEDVPVRNVLLRRQAVIILQHAEYVLVNVVPEVSVGESLV
mmetsp:Transcript_2224/g.6780  ORF Transcript_2224/g.6780 Transcript_2224/m.6780 type:complete len:260 (-) Transcript_2224:427-1206(-)